MKRQELERAITEIFQNADKDVADNIFTDLLGTADDATLKGLIRKYAKITLDRTVRS